MLHHKPDGKDARRGLSQRFFAWLYGEGLGGSGGITDEYKRKLLSGLEGRVLEIGAGTGDNFPFYPAEIEWVGVEPNAYMHPHLLKNAREHHVQGELRTGVAEQLDFPDASMDAVVCTFVLCSVTDQDRALAEIARVLRPGGRFVFIEHVAAPRGSRQRIAQRLTKPLWRLLSDGCHPDRETWAAIESAPFARVEIEHFHDPVPIVSPHIAGYAVK
jgi:ubiquinone/menaquinone biosynthesis C-methylase UbiE